MYLSKFVSVSPSSYQPELWVVNPTVERGLYANRLGIERTSMNGMDKFSCFPHVSLNAISTHGIAAGSILSKFCDSSRSGKPVTSHLGLFLHVGLRIHASGFEVGFRTLHPATTFIRLDCPVLITLGLKRSAVSSRSVLFHSKKGVDFFHTDLWVTRSMETWHCIKAAH